VRLDPTPDGRGCLLAVRAQPGARRDGATGIRNGSLALGVTSPAEDGRANADLERLLAEILGLRKSQVRLHSGERSREKRFRIEADAGTVRARIEAHLERQARRKARA